MCRTANKSNALKRVQCFGLSGKTGKLKMSAFGSGKTGGILIALYLSHYTQKKVFVRIEIILCGENNVAKDGGSLQIICREILTGYMSEFNLDGLHTPTTSKDTGYF